MCVGGGNVGTQPIYTAIRTEDVRGINLPIRPPSQHSRFRDGQARIHRRAESIISVSSSSDPRPHPPESSESSPPDSSEFIIDVILILASFSSVPSSCLPPHPSLIRHTSLPPSVLRPPSTLLPPPSALRPPPYALLRPPSSFLRPRPPSSLFSYMVPRVLLPPSSAPPPAGGGPSGSRAGRSVVGPGLARTAVSRKRSKISPLRVTRTKVQGYNTPVSMDRGRQFERV